MKRTPLKRKTPLRNRKPLRRGTPLIVGLKERKAYDVRRLYRLRSRSRKMELYARADALWSEAVRLRDKYCQHCGKGPKDAILDAMHIVRRGVLALRWNVKNGILGCREFHEWAHSRPVFFRAWVEKNLPGRLTELGEVEGMQRFVKAMGCGSDEFAREAIARLQTYCGLKKQGESGT